MRLRTLLDAAALAAVLLAAFLASHPAAAQQRPLTTAMTCADATRLVVARGGIVLGTGTYTYDRYVRDGASCVPEQITEIAFVPTRDNPQCPVGYRCRDRFGRGGGGGN